MTTILKYPLEIKDEQTVKLPDGAKILTAQVQLGKLCIWALVDDREERTTDMRIEIFGTGHNIPTGTRVYLGTVQMREGTLVWHVFENIASS